MRISSDLDILQRWRRPRCVRTCVSSHWQSYWVRIMSMFLSLCFWMLTSLPILTFLLPDMTFKRRGEGERASCDKFDFYVCQNNHVWSYLCPGGSQPIIPWASDPRFGRTSDDSEIVAPLALHLRRVDKGETYIQCLVLEAGLYQNYEREERKGRRKRNIILKDDEMKNQEEEKKRRRRRSSICDVTLYLKGPCTALCTNTLSQTVSL